MPENQTAWSSDSQGIKETVSQNNQTSAPRQRNMAQMKEPRKTSERKLSDEEIANLSDREFKALVIKMLTELIELGQKKKIKRTSERYSKQIKQNIQGTNSERKETRTQNKDLEEKEGITFQLEQNEERKIQKMGRSLEPLGQL